MGSLKKVAAVAGVLFIILLAVVSYLALWTGDTKEIEAVADQFQPGASWTVINEQVEPPRYLCLDGGTCPEINKTWKIPEVLTRKQFTEAVPESYNTTISGNCPEILPSELNLQYGCSATGSKDGFDILIAYSIDPQFENKYRITLNIRKGN